MIPSLPGPLRRALLVAFIALTIAVPASAATTPVHVQLQVDGVAREALVYAPESAKTTPAPLVFVFHGHGGTMQMAGDRFGFQRLWPEAIVVCPQGLPTVGQLTDPQGTRAGWQHTIGVGDDRDLKFFDALLARVKTDYKVDDKRIYATGHSNGGGFTYVLWAARGDVFAAVAPSSAVANRQRLADFKPKPVLHVAGESDPLVKYEWQSATMTALRHLNQCGDGQPWGDHLTLYPSKINAPVVTYIHPGGHTFPPEAIAAIVKFFKEQAKP